MKRASIGFALALTVTAAANAQSVMGMQTPLGNVLTDEMGMTLYTFDRDTQGGPTSACEGNCLVNWPPFLAAEGAAAHDEWTLVDVNHEGAVKKMWARDGWPLYYWRMDVAPGDVSGDGVGGVWHVIVVE